jgi:hexosaminidase
MKRFKNLLFLFLALTTVALSYFVGKRAYYYQSGLPQNRKDIIPQKPGFITYTINIKESNLNAVNLFKSLPHYNSDIVFLGTSLTQGFPLQEMLSDCRIKNRGIGGNTIDNILNRLDEVTNGKPAKIFLEVGTNDLKPGCDIDSVFNKFSIIIKTIKKTTPLTKIYVQSVLPFGKNNAANIEQYNTRLKTYCVKNALTFINLYPLFLQDGSLKKELTTDGTHLKANGYLIWKNAIEQYL